MRASLLAAVLVGIAAGPAIGQDRPTRFGDGTEYFRYILKRSGAAPLTSADTLWDNPRSKALIVFGRTEILDRLARHHGLRRFLDNGGRVLIATDRGTSDAVFQEIGIRITGETWQMPDGFSQYVYRQTLNQCPLVIDFARAQTGRPTAPFFQGDVTDTGSQVTKIATNLPSQIAQTQFFLPVATLYRPGPGFGLLPAGARVQNQVMLGAQSLRWKGNLFVLADHSIFINDMMCQVDNDNAPFATNIVQWLMDAGNGRRRTEVLFYDDGRVQTQFNVSLEYPQPALPPLVPLADEIIIGMERDNAFNDTLLDVTGGIGPILRTGALVLTIALLLIGLYRFLQSRYRPESRVPRLPGRLDALQAAVPAVERRHQAVIAQGNLAEAARELAHQAFAALGLTPTPDAPPPAVDVTGRWSPFRSHRWARQVRGLWKLAARGPAGRVSPAALQRLDMTLHDLLAAVAAGRVRLAAAESPI